VRRAYRYPVLPPNGPYAPDQPLLAPRPAPPPSGIPPGYANYGQWPAAYPYAAPPAQYGGGYPGAPQPSPYYAAPVGAAPAPAPFWPPPPPPGGGYSAPATPTTAGASTEPPSVPPVPADTGPFLEAFAIYLCSQIAVGLFAALVLRSWSMLSAEWLLVLFLPVWFLWPIWRGVSRAELLRGLGWHRGRGVLREMAAGIGGYIGGLPLLVAAIIVTSVLGKISNTTPEHPIQFEVGKGWWNTLQIYLLACLWAPFVEETMFRGAFFHHLRQRWRWLAAAPLVALLFAALHPQGWTAIPVLGTLALTFAGIREWRGSIIGCMTAHFLQNFTVATVLILSLS
jgi:membrane protease YdiL (CAAX protease family)